MIILMLYRLAWLFALPLIRATALLERAPDAATRKRTGLASWRLAERLSVHASRENGEGGGREAFWLHAASLGECKGLWAFACRLEEELAARGEAGRILLTTNTTTGLDFLRRAIADVPDPARRGAFTARVAPLDHPRLARSFLRAHRVRALVLFEVELWPHWIAAARRAGVPVSWISARLTQRARRRYAGNPLFAAALRRVLRNIAWIQAQTKDEEHALRRLGAAHAETGGDLRGLHSLRLASGRPEARDEASRRGVAFVSIHARELEDIIPLLPKADAATPEPVFVFPRKLEEVPAFLRRLEPHGFVLHSRHAERPPHAGDAPAPRVIVDAYGRVDETLSRVRTAVIGGSFGRDARIGGHNVWEPLLAGCRIVIGPHHVNQRALVDRLKHRGLISIAREQEARANEAEIRRAFVAEEAARLNEAARRGCDAILKHRCRRPESR